MKKILIIFLPILLFFSCEKVVNIDLNKDQERIVIEGHLLNGDTIHRVKIQKTVNFDQSNNYPAVNNASVTVEDNLGNVATFSSVGNGWYELAGYTGVPGRTYKLTVVVEGKTYSASSKMPDLVQLTSLEINPIVFATDTAYLIAPVRTDPVGIRNFYSFDIRVNGNKTVGFNLQNDLFSDGNLIVEPLQGVAFFKFDTLEICMANIDKAVYQYYNQLATNTSGLGATPANPISNFSGGCLGYFSAQSIDIKSIIIQ